MQVDSSIYRVAGARVCSPEFSLGETLKTRRALRYVPVWCRPFQDLYYKSPKSSLLYGRGQGRNLTWQRSFDVLSRDEISRNIKVVSFWLRILQAPLI